MSSSMRRLVPVGLLIVLAMMVSACGYGDSPSEPGNRTATVAVVDDSFDPSSVTVETGGTVTWEWQGSNEHNVTWSSADLADSSTQVSGSHSVTMPSDTGNYDYYCTIHGTPTSGMRGTVTVTAGSRY